MKKTITFATLALGASFCLPLAHAADSLVTAPVLDPPGICTDRNGITYSPGSVGFDSCLQARNMQPSGTPTPPSQLGGTIPLPPNSEPGTTPLPPSNPGAGNISPGNISPGNTSPGNASPGNATPGESAGG